MTCNLGLMDVCQRYPIIGCDECPNSSSFSEEEKKYLNKRMKENKELLQRLS